MGQELYRLVVAASLFVCACYLINFAANPVAEHPSTIFDSSKTTIFEASASPKPDEPEEVCVCGAPVPEPIGGFGRH